MPMYDNQTAQYGLLTNIASGIKEGLIGYQTLKNQQHDQKMQELLSGVTKDENGELTLSPEMQQKKAFEAQKLADERGVYEQAHKGDSEFSKRSAAIHGLLAKKLGYGDETTYQGLPAAQIEQMDKGLVSPASSIYVGEQKANATTEAAHTRADAAAEAKAAAAAARAEAAAAKATEKQGSNYKDLRNHLETFRGNQAAQQAAVKVQNADTALAIVKDKDPNTLTTQDLRLLAEEMGKIASGGVPGEHGTQALMPSNLQTKVAEMTNFLSSRPTDAKAAEYIKHNMAYLEEMKNVAQGTIKSYRKNIAAGYKTLVRPEDYAEAAKDYGFGDAEPKGLIGGAKASAGFTPDILKYAADHKITPEQAQAIKLERTKGAK